MPAASQSSLAKALLPSSRAAAALGPQQRMPASASASARPATSGRFRAGDDEVHLVLAGEADQAGDVLGVDGDVFAQRRGAGIAGRRP